MTIPFCVNSPSYVQQKVKLGHKFSQLIHKFNIWISIHKEMGFFKRWDEINFCPLTFIFGQLVRVVFQYDDMWHQRIQFMIKLAVFKKKCQ